MRFRHRRRGGRRFGRRRRFGGFRRRGSAGRLRRRIGFRM